MSKMLGKVVIIEDDKELGRAIGTYLHGRGYEVDLFFGYAEARQKLPHSADVAVVDLNLGDGDGHRLLKHIRVKNPLVHVIIFTAFDSLPKRLQSFALGADDYMKKPIFPSELEARIRRLLRPTAISEHHVQLAVPPGLLTKQEETLLRLLVATHGAPIPLAVLTHAAGASAGSVYTALSRLKKKVAGLYTLHHAYGRGWWGEKMG